MHPLIGFPLNNFGFPPCWRAYFLLLRQKKVAKEKATPSCAVGFADCPALLETPGGWLNSPAAQTTPADCPRRFSVARRSTRGPQSGARPATCRFFDCYDRPEKKAKNTYPSSTTDALPGPLSGAEQRRRAGGFRLALSEPQASSGKPPGPPSSARDRATPGANPGVAFSLATFFWPHKRKYARQQGGTPSQFKGISKC